MAKYRADVEGERYYPEFALVVEPGDVVDLPSGIVAAGLTPVETKSTKSAPVETEPDASVDAPTLGV